LESLAQPGKGASLSFRGHIEIKRFCDVRALSLSPPVISEINHHLSASPCYIYFDAIEILCFAPTCSAVSVAILRSHHCINVVEFTQCHDFSIATRLVCGTSVILLTDVDFPSRSLPVKEIGISAFSNSALQPITIPATVQVLNRSCFVSCKSLASVTFAPDSHPKRIKMFAFSNCYIGSLAIAITV
jgi:hypothetical protein